MARAGFAKLHLAQIILLVSLGISSVSRGLKPSPYTGSGVLDNNFTISAESRSYMGREAARDLEWLQGPGTYFQTNITVIIQEKITAIIMILMSFQNNLLSSGIKIDFVCIMTKLKQT